MDLLHLLLRPVLTLSGLTSQITRALIQHCWNYTYLNLRDFKKSCTKKHAWYGVINIHIISIICTCKTTSVDFNCRQGPSSCFVEISKTSLTIPIDCTNSLANPKWLPCAAYSRVDSKSTTSKENQNSAHQILNPAHTFQYHPTNLVELRKCVEQECKIQTVLDLAAVTLDSYLCQ